MPTRMLTSLSLPFLMLFIMAGLLLPETEVFAQKKKKRNKTTTVSPAADIVLTENEMSRYRILLPSSPTFFEKKAASVLQEYLLEISGAALPVIAADDDRSPYEIVLGQNDRLDDLSLKINFNALKEDGFTIRTDSMRLIIAGGNEKGTLYG